MFETPVEVEFDQNDDSTLIMGEAEYGRIRFVAQIDESKGFVEEQEFVSSLEDALEDSIVRDRTETVQS